ncbi:Arylsulfotransferase-domain-containing protein [Xylariaceae sp. FL0594]|nr:Arylsulfotransferase-domain-containing protein [Xylariaceae sp. FL0594]
MPRLSLVVSVTCVLLRGVLADADLVFDAEGYNHGRYGANPHQRYHSTDVSSPLLLVNQWDANRTDDAQFIFLTLASPVNEGTVGPVIYRAADLSLVYSNPRWSGVHDAHVARFNDADYLVFLAQSRTVSRKSVTTDCLMYDSTYTLAYNVSSPGPSSASMGIHECQLSSGGSAVVVLIERIPFDLSSVGGPANGEVLDNIVQEIDVATGNLVWMWRASDHYDLSESYYEYTSGPGPYDYIHINSAAKVSDGNFLVSARHTHSVTLVDQKSGKRIWTLGGKNSSFADRSNEVATDFAWQHHARFTDPAQRQLTIFDNHGNTSVIGCVANCSRGKHVELDYQRQTARLVHEFYHPERLASGFKGSYQTLDNGNVVLGWGANPTFTEHTPDGECVLDVQFDAWRPDEGYPANYRAFKMNWTGMPDWDPQIAAVVAGDDGRVKIYVSWNGATEVATWELLGGNSINGTFGSTITVPRKGFETEIPVPGPVVLPFVRAAACDGNGKVLGMTAIVRLVQDGTGTNNA